MPQAPSRSAYREAHIALALLFLVGIVNYFDRLALGVLQVPIKQELQFSDTQLGLLTGLAFFIPFTALAIPIARLADRHNRKIVLAVALVVWSSMTAMISVAQGFLLILVLRMGVAIGEAACLPTTYSLLSDFYPPEKRGRAIAIFGMSLPLGSLLGIAGAGALADALGWRQTILLLGSLGLVLAPVMLLVMREPPRGGAFGASAPAVSRPPPPLGAAMRILWRHRVLRFIALGLGCQAYVTTTVLSWSPPFYTRSHGMELSEVAFVLGLITGIGGSLGNFFGGTLADRFGRDNQRFYLLVPAIGCAMVLPIGLCQFLLPQQQLSFAFAFFTMMLVTGFAPPLYAIAQSLVAANMRALTSALMVMSSALLGGAWGPSVTGYLSDLLVPHAGDSARSLQLALCCGVLFSAAAGWFFYRAACSLEPVPPGEAHGGNGEHDS